MFFNKRTKRKGPEGLSYLIFYYPVETNGNGNFTFNCDVVKIETNKKDAESHFKAAIETLQGPEPEPNQDCPWCNWNKN